MSDSLHSTCPEWQSTFVRPKWRWAGPHLTQEPRCIMGFPFSGATPGNYLPYGQVTQYSQNVFKRMTENGLKYTTFFSRGPLIENSFNGYFDGDSHRYNEFIGQRYTCIVCWLLWGLLPRIRYRFYWSCGEPLSDTQPPVPGAIRYTEFTPADTYHLLFANQSLTLSGPALNPDGSLSDELLSIQPQGGLIDGKELDVGQDLTGRQGCQPVCYEGNTNGTNWTPEPASYAGPNGAYSTASMGILVES